MLKREEMPVCDVATTVQILDSKWKLLIIRDLMTGPKRPAQLLKSLSGLSQKVLTASLKSMISDGIVEKIDYNTMPPHVEYRLSPDAIPADGLLLRVGKKSYHRLVLK